MALLPVWASLFAAFDTKTGKIISQLHRRHRSLEFRKFLDKIDAAVPPGFDVHLILDNYGAHKTATIQRWLLKRPRFQLHFTPTSASWINLVERCWDDESSIKILKNIRSAMSENQKVLIVEMVVPEGNEPHPSKALDVLMLVMEWVQPEPVSSRVTFFVL